MKNKQKYLLMNTITLGNKLKRVLLMMLIILLANISIVYAQTIKPKNKFNNTEFVIDSLALKEYSVLIKENRKFKPLYFSVNKQLTESKSENVLLKYKLKLFKESEKDLLNAIETKEESFMIERKKHKAKIKKIKWQRTKSYIFGGGAVLVSILIIVAN